jgi:hypothetical protein
VAGDFAAGLDVVDAVVGEALGLGGVGVERDDGDALLTAALMAAVRTLASVTLMAMPSTPEETSCSTYWAWAWASSLLGVRQLISMVTPIRRRSLGAVASAPVRAAWKTGLPWLLAMTPKV